MSAFEAGMIIGGAKVGFLEERIATLEAKLAQAREALISCESPHFCPSCDAKLGPQTHRPDCLLRAVLDMVEGQG